MVICARRFDLETRRYCRRPAQHVGTRSPDPLPECRGHGRGRGSPILVERIQRRRTVCTQLNMPSASTSTFNSPKCLEVVFVPLNDGAIRHGRVLDQARAAPSRSLGYDKPTHVLRQVAGKADESR